jgi:PAS domain S-box-containing protein
MKDESVPIIPKKQSWRGSIVVRMSVFFLALAIIPMLATAYYSLYRSQAEISSVSRNNLIELSHGTAHRIGQLLIENQRTSATLAGEPLAVRFLTASEEERLALNENVYQMLQNFSETHPDYDAPGLLDANGIVVASLAESLVGKDRSFRDYFQASIQGEPFISDILVGRGTGRPGVFLTNPVVTTEGEIVGIDIIWLKGSTIWSIIDDVNVGEEGIAYLVDQDGVIIAHPNRDLLYHSLSALSPEAASIISETIRFGILEGTDSPLIPQSLGMDELAAELASGAGSGSYGYYSPLDHRDHMVGYSRLEATPWIVVVDLPEDQFLAPLSRLKLMVWSGTGFMAVIALIVSILLAHGITQPIRCLTDAASAVHKGQPFEPSDIEDVTSGQDEIAILGRMFSSMVLGLRKEITEREKAEQRLEHLNRVMHAIRNVNQLITKEKDRDELLQGACDNLTETRGYRSAWIALLDETGGFISANESGLGEDFLPVVEQLKGGKIPDCVGRALSQPGVVIIEDASACDQCPLADKCIDEGAITIRLEYEGKIYGVCSVSNPVDRIMDEEESELFNEIAGDIAFALHNIELEKKRKQAEEALKHRLLALSQPVGKIGDLSFAESFEVASLIFDEEGKPITAPSNFSDFCKILRATEKGEKRCKLSDARLAKLAANGSPVMVPCSNFKEIMDGAVPIFIGDKQIATWAIGQKVNSEIPEHKLRSYAKEISADADKLVEASKYLYIGSREQFSKALSFLHIVANDISLLGLQNIQQARDITERIQAKARIDHLNLVLRAVRNVNQLITKEKDRDELLQGACDNLTETRGYHSAWIALLDETGEFVSASESGLGEDFLPVVEQLKGGKIPDCVGRVLSQPGAVIIEDASTCDQCPLADKCSGRGVLTVRLEYEGKIFGVSSVSIPIDLIMGEEEGEIFREVAGDIAFALHNIELEKERKQVEKALQESEENFRALAENAGEGILIATSEGAHVYANKRAAEITGYSIAELLKIKMKDLAHPDEFKKLAERLQKRIAKEYIPKQYETAIITKDGKKVLVDVTGAQTSWRGKPADIVIMHDISERKRAEEALLESEKNLSQIVQGSSTPIFVIDKNHIVTYWNKACEKLTGISASEVIGTKKQWQAFYAEERPLMADFLVDEMPEKNISKYYIGKYKKSALIEGAYEAEDFFLDLGEKGKWLFITAAPLKDRQGKIIGAIETLQDITERVRAEKALQQYSKNLEDMVDERTKKLQDAQEQLIRKEKLAVLGQLAGGVAHELRNPLGVISNATYFLKNILPEADETTKEYLELISDEVSSSEKIISDLLGLSRALPSEREETPIAEIVDRVLEKHPAPIDIEVIREIPDDISPIFVDPQQIEQVLFNLAQNAYQAISGKGKLIIKARDKGETIHLKVTDTGAGISKQNMQKLFDPLFTTKARGIGLGLAISKRLMEANGGSIEVESEVGMGTTFTVILPCKGVS